MSILFPEIGPAVDGFPALSKTVREPVDAFASSVAAGTVVESEKLASAALARPEPPSEAVQAIATLSECHTPSAEPQFTVGPAVSSVIESVAVPEILFAASLNCAQTVFEPSPLVSACEIVVVKLVADVTGTKVAPEQSDPFATRYAVTPTASVALNARDTVVLFVNAAPALIETAGLAGAVVSVAAA